MAELRTIDVLAEAKGQRLDQFIAQFLTIQGDPVSRSRVQLLLEQGDVLVNGLHEKASFKLRGGERIDITGEPRPAPLKATPEEIPLDVVYEDADLAVVNKPAGMMVHAGAGQNDDVRNRGTLVNALLYRCLLYTSMAIHLAQVSIRISLDKRIALVGVVILAQGCEEVERAVVVDQGRAGRIGTQAVVDIGAGAHSKNRESGRDVRPLGLKRMEAVEQRVRLKYQSDEAGAEEQAENESRDESSARIERCV